MLFSKNKFSKSILEDKRESILRISTVLFKQQLFRRFFSVDFVITTEEQTPLEAYRERRQRVDFTVCCNYGLFFFLSSYSVKSLELTRTSHLIYTACIYEENKFIFA